MWKKIAIGGAIAAATLGAGTAALAASGSTTTPGTPASSSAGSSHGGRHAGVMGLARRTLHGQFVTGKAGSSSFVTHDVIRGQVTAVSPTSITVKAADNTSETFVVNSDTKVRMRSNGKGAASSISQVKNGDNVFVLGTGTSTFTATGIVDVKK